MDLRVFATVVAFAVSYGANADAQKLECRDSASQVQQVICTDPTLSSYDLVLESWANRLGDAQPDPANWIQARNQCGTDRDCLLSAYLNRIQTLQMAAQALEDRAPVISPSLQHQDVVRHSECVGPQCTGDVGDTISGTAPANNTPDSSRTIRSAPYISRQYTTTPGQDDFEAALALAIVLLILGAIFLFFLPSITACKRQHKFVLVFFVNILLGWTVIGWLVALFLACGERSSVTTIIQQMTVPTGGETLAQKIEKLHSLLQRGAITQAEFDQQKSRLFRT